MVSGCAKKKVIGGKLLTVKLEFGSFIQKAEISGDFFLYPEEKLGEIEKCLVGVSINCDKNSLSMAISKAVKENGIDMIGIDPESISETVIEAIKNGMESYRPSN
ncbi:MAG: hypothetical protein QXF01_01215 [Candidatus Micrarchaeaceae archaeon]